MKGTPHGIMDNHDEEKVNIQKIEVWAQDIQGIIYYIDNFNNVYQAEDLTISLLKRSWRLSMLQREKSCRSMVGLRSFLSPKPYKLKL